MIYEFSQFIRKNWLGKWRVYDPRAISYLLFKIYPKFRSYGFHDAFVKIIFYLSKISKGNLENFIRNFT